MAYEIISGDCHLDPEYLPPETFVERAPASMKERVPRVVEKDGGAYWMAGEQTLGLWGAAYLKQNLARTRRGQAMLAAGFAEEGLHPSDPDKRIEDMERDGVDAELIYGPLRRWKYMASVDPDLGQMVCSLYNDYIAEFCASRPGRFYALAAVPPDDLEAIVSEIERAAGLNLSGLEVALHDPDKPAWDAYWDPLWAAAARHRLPVHIHIPAARDRIEASTSLTDRAAWMSSMPMNMGYTLASIILGGVLDRHPEAQVVMAESGIGWVPYLLDRMDYEWADSYDQWKDLTPTPPSETFRKQGYATFQQDEAGPQLAALYPDNFIWGSDYPHLDGVWPDSAAILSKTMDSLDADLRRKLTRDNAARLYRMNV